MNETSVKKIMLTNTVTVANVKYTCQYYKVGTDIQIEQLCIGSRRISTSTMFPKVLAQIKEALKKA